MSGFLFIPRSLSLFLFLSLLCREETEIIEGEVVEIQIDRPTTTSVSSTPPTHYSHREQYPASVVCLPSSCLLGC